MAKWKAKYEVQGDTRRVDYLYFHAADAASRKPAAIQAAIRNAEKRALQRLKHCEAPVRILEVDCVG